MKIVLLGGSGFIGKYLERILSSRKECKIIVAGRGASLKSNLYKDAQILVIMTQPDQQVIKDVVSLINYSKVLKKVLYLSTLLVYPDSPSKQNENVTPDPQIPYEKDKYKEELLLSETTKTTSCKLCIARLSNVYGDVKNRGIVNLILLSLMKKNDLVINGDPKAKIKDYIFVEDAAFLLEFLIFYNQENQKEIFNICTSKGTSLQQLLDELEVVTGKKISFRVGKEILEKTVSVGDNSKILKLSGYRLKYNLEKGLKKTYQNYLNLYLV